MDVPLLLVYRGNRNLPFCVIKKQARISRITAGMKAPSSQPWLPWVLHSMSILDFLRVLRTLHVDPSVQKYVSLQVLGRRDIQARVRCTTTTKSRNRDSCPRSMSIILGEYCETCFATHGDLSAAQMPKCSVLGGARSFAKSSRKSLRLSSTALSRLLES